MYNYNELKVINPSFDSKLTSLILELDYLRKKEIKLDVPPVLFMELKEIFHLFESIGSLRIEGNRTTVFDYIESKVENKKEQNIIEIENNEKALLFIEENISNLKIDRAFLSQLHKILMENLGYPPMYEGSRNPGEYRKINVKISGSNFLPPDIATVTLYMEELFEFINRDDLPQYDLIKVAIAHHRFAWIHPFDNGNGRMARLLTYAMLLKYGFMKSIKTRILNPTAVFCNNRQKYYEMLNKADNGEESNLILWSEYILEGIKNEIEKIDRLSQYDYLAGYILKPLIKKGYEKNHLDSEEYKILSYTIDKRIIKAEDIKKILSLGAGMSDSVKTSRIAKRLLEKGFIRKESENSRKYALSLSNKFFLKILSEIFEEKGFISKFLTRSEE